MLLSRSMNVHPEPRKSWTGRFHRRGRLASRGHHWRASNRLTVEPLEARTLLAGFDLATAVPIDATGEIADAIGTPGEADFFKLTVSETGRLRIRVDPAPQTQLDTRLSLLASDGRLLIQSDGESAGDLGGRITQHVTAGTYALQVEGSRDSTGYYILATQFLAASPPLQPIPIGHEMEGTAMVTGDFNEDGIEDVANGGRTSQEFAILLGLGDRTFELPRFMEIGLGHVAMALSDLNADGHGDLSLPNIHTNEVTVLLGHGDGTFEDPMRFAVGEGVWAVAAVDLNSDAIVDLATSNQGTNDVSVLLGRGDGTFEDQLRIPVVGGPDWIVAADFNRDGHADLATANFESNDVSVLLGRGDGTFQDELRFSVSGGPWYVGADDLNEDGQLDLVTSGEAPFVSVLLGRGDGSFQDQVQYEVGDYSWPTLMVDLNDDRHLDLVNSHSNDISVLLGQGNGKFQDTVHYTAGAGTGFIATADFNADHRPDLAIGNYRSFAVTILLGRGDGTFPDLGRVGFGTQPSTPVAADFNSDGQLDIALLLDFVPGETILLLGRGDATFHEGVPIAGPMGVQTVDDFNSDGVLDLVGTHFTLNIVSVVLGVGDGTFQEGGQFPVGVAPGTLVQGDFDENGILDVATANQYSNDISVLLGIGDGTFENESRYAAGRIPWDIVTGDFDADGHLDLAVSNPGNDGLETGPEADDLSVFFGRGDGTFEEQVTFNAGDQQPALVAADFNGDAIPDIAGANFGTSDVSVLLSRGDGTFVAPVQYATGTPFNAFGLVAGDLDDDKRLDLVSLNWFEQSISVLLGRGDGTFQDEKRITTGVDSESVLIGDFNGDGNQDLLLTNRSDPWNDIWLLLGHRDGTFDEPLRFAAGTTLTAKAIATADFNDDGRTDFAAAEVNSQATTVSLGLDDGSFQKAAVALSGVTSPVSVAAADFNRDGRLDLATVDYGSNELAVALGFGDGTYRDSVLLVTGERPIGVVAGDFNGDGGMDLASVNSASNDISLLVGRGDGTFEEQVRLSVGDSPVFLLAADFNSDSRLDLATANYLSNDVSLLLGRGDGTFQQEARVPIDNAPISIATGDFDLDGRLDFVTANYTANELTVLFGRADGSFVNPLHFSVGTLPRSVFAADFNGDGRLDLVSANYNSDDISVLLGLGDGTFADQMRFPTERYPAFVTADDFNGDGRLDVAVANEAGTGMTLLLGLGDATFVTPDTIASAVRSTPHVADLNRDTVPDVAVINRAGQILVRLGRPDNRGVFEPPIVVNPDNRDAARDLAVVRTDAGLLLAALDARTSSVSFYQHTADGRFERAAAPLVLPGTLPARLTAGDLDGDGRDDLVVVTSGSTEALVYVQSPARGGLRPAGPIGPATSDGLPASALLASPPFASNPDYRARVGLVPSDVQTVDVDGDGRRDIVATSQFSGDVSVILNDPVQPFSETQRFRSGPGLYYLEERPGGIVPRSGEGTAALAFGDFDHDGVVDLAAANSDSNSIALLRGTGTGGFYNPQRSLTYGTGVHPSAVATGDFNRDGRLDVAVLNDGSADVTVFLGSSDGRLVEMVARDREGNKLPLSAGNSPSGLATSDVDRDGKVDLLVGNEFGDVLTLLGNGDGTFQPYRRTSRNIALAVADLNSDGRDDFIFGNEALDRVSVQYSQSAAQFVQERDDGLLAPGSVITADLNGDALRDLVVANSGANNVLVYLGTGSGQFSAARSFFAGTNPGGITVQDVNNDLLPDLLVANEGSNDVTLLLGSRAAGGWTLEPGPRLRSGGSGPVAVTVQDVTGPNGFADGIQDLLVTNRQSNTVSVLAGVGQGFFDDRSPQLFNTGIDPRQALVGNFDASPGLDLVTVNFGSDDLTLFPSFGLGLSIPTGGERPISAIEEDFNDDGLSDLAVANNGSGEISLMLGDAEGLTLAKVFSLAEVLHPTALAMGADESVVYISTEGEELAVRLALDLGIAVPVFNLGETVFEPGERLAEVLPLSETGLALVAIVLNVASEDRGLTELIRDTQPIASTDPLMSLLVAFTDSGNNRIRAPAFKDDQFWERAIDEPPKNEPPDTPAEGGSETELLAFLMGLDEAVEQSAAELHDWLLLAADVPPIVDSASSARDASTAEGSESGQSDRGERQEGTGESSETTPSKANTTDAPEKDQAKDSTPNPSSEAAPDDSATIQPSVEMESSRNERMSSETSISDEASDWILDQCVGESTTTVMEVNTSVECLFVVAIAYGTIGSLSGGETGQSHQFKTKHKQKCFHVAEG